MASETQRPAVIVIAGPTASGKSEAALSLAEKIGGEIICADSRTVYKQLSVGVAKPTKADRHKVAHHCLDLVNLDETFNVSDFKLAAGKAISDIVSRGRTPIIAGGSGLYIDALVYDYSLNNPVDTDQRSKLNNMSIEQLQQIILNKNLPMPLNNANKRHLVRTIETDGRIPIKHKKPDDVIYTAIAIDKEALRSKISQRVERMYESGFIGELEILLKKYPERVVRNAGIGYSAGVDYLLGNLTLEQAKNAFVKGDLLLAKRQITWLKRNPDIVWFRAPNKLVEFVVQSLSK